MLGNKLRKVLTNINFVERYIALVNSYSKSPSSQITITFEKFIQILDKTELKFLRTGNSFAYNTTLDSITFRLIFETYKDNYLTYFYILKNGEFVNNGSSHLGYLLNYFDLREYKINQNFGYNNYKELKDSINLQIEMFNDFVSEYLVDFKPN